MFTQNARKAERLQLALLGFVATLILLVPLGMLTFGQGIPAAESLDAQPEYSTPIPDYMHPETKGENGVRGGLHIGDLQGIEYWEAIDSAGYRCLIYGDPVSLYSGSSCIEESRFNENGAGTIFIFPSSKTGEPTEAQLIPTDVDGSQLEELGYAIVNERVAVLNDVGRYENKRIRLPRENKEMPQFEMVAAPRMDKAEYMN